ncbi:helix-turn-helix transcriptional regulator [Pelagibius sp. Alg239-R121]|uniref:ArsR/SmtB family transcription factor n=1 Tax=Pelagibius sp. Alg239-R121 TaxID=2993448 RepID=UPI0024A68539|nr:metalloregulator ArsR/SmtB family transcription factor [Pelagibius sp. Alg239-R121]
MVKYSINSLDAVFSALGDGTRRAILARLAEGETRVTDLAAPYEMSLPAVSKHLRVLEAAGLVTKRKQGRVIYCSLQPQPLMGAADWIAFYRSFWERKFDALASYLDKTADTSPKPANADDQGKEQNDG